MTKKIESGPEETRHNMSIEELREKELGSLEEVGKVEDPIEEQEVSLIGNDLSGVAEEDGLEPLIAPEDEHNDEDMGE